jgi:hypothetical protein
MRFLPPEKIIGPAVLISKLAPAIGNRADGNSQSTESTNSMNMTLDDARKLVASHSPQQIEAKLARTHKHPRALASAHALVAKAQRLQASADQGPALRKIVDEILAIYPTMTRSEAFVQAARRLNILH